MRLSSRLYAKRLYVVTTYILTKLKMHSWTILCRYVYIIILLNIYTTYVTFITTVTVWDRILSYHVIKIQGGFCTCISYNYCNCDNVIYCLHRGAAVVTDRGYPGLYTDVAGGTPTPAPLQPFMRAGETADARAIRNRRRRITTGIAVPYPLPPPSLMPPATATTTTPAVVVLETLPVTDSSRSEHARRARAPVNF